MPKYRVRQYYQTYYETVVEADDKEAAEQAANDEDQAVRLMENLEELGMAYVDEIKSMAN